MSSAALIWKKSTLPAHVLHIWLICNPTVLEIKGKKRRDFFSVLEWL